MPAEENKHPRTSESIPDVGDPDRKRVLNVLAQRRYRQRRRQKIVNLESQVKDSNSLCASLSDDNGGTWLIDDTSRSISGSDHIDCDFNVEDIPVPGNTELQIPVTGFVNDVIGVSQDFAASATSSKPSPQTFNFPLTPDATFFTVPILASLRAFSIIATTLGVLTHIYDPFYLHTLSSTPHPSLPPNLHPTPGQIAIPHHPVLDCLPWPSVREKLICMFAIPSECRPAIARDGKDMDGQAKAVVQLMQDLDDFAGGCRVHANLVGWGEGNEMVEEAWEVGECFFKNWWWSIDRRVIEISNRRRRERGLGTLKITG